MKYNSDIHHRRSIRLPGYDYSQSGFYFITICTFNKELYFGKIIQNKMYLSEIGKIAKKYWIEIPQHFQFSTLDEFIIMPNHVHGIIVIENDNGRTFNQGVAMQRPYSISPKHGTLSTIIRSYKSACTKTINTIQNKYHFAWQSNYYEHIIRNEESLNNIREYIINNPTTWEKDTLFV